MSKCPTCGKNYPHGLHGGIGKVLVWKPKRDMLSGTHFHGVVRDIKTGEEIGYGIYIPCPTCKGTGEKEKP